MCDEEEIERKRGWGRKKWWWERGRKNPGLLSRFSTFPSRWILLVFRQYIFFSLSFLVFFLSLSSFFSHLKKSVRLLALRACICFLSSYMNVYECQTWKVRKREEFHFFPFLPLSIFSFSSSSPSLHLLLLFIFSHPVSATYISWIEVKDSLASSFFSEESSPSFPFPNHEVFSSVINLHIRERTSLLVCRMNLISLWNDCSNASLSLWCVVYGTFNFKYESMHEQEKKKRKEFAYERNWKEGERERVGKGERVGEKKRFWF